MHKSLPIIKKKIPQLPSIKLHLHKTIPPAAGLGGGSADGAFTLKLLNQKYGLGLSTKELLDYALKLGTDCPFFIINQSCVAHGRGEFLETMNLDLSGYKFIIVNPGIHISTTKAFSFIVPALPSKSIKNIIQQPIETWKGNLKNDFEEPLFKKHPEIRVLRDDLYKAGAIYASMTGSGSTVYGIFKKDMDASLVFPGNYFIKELIS